MCGKVRNQDSDPTQGHMEDLQKAQNKLFCLLNNTRIKDKIKTKSIAEELKMLSVNQINAQVKLTEMWKSLNVENYPVKVEKQAAVDDHRLARSIKRGDLVLQGNSETNKAAFITE